MNELALFAGAGGGILGGHLLGWRTVCAVEWEPYAASVLAARQNDGVLPAFPIWSDIRTFDGREWAGIVDVVSGGFPCQDISVAGNGDGLDGERSGLWREMARVVREVRPRFVFVENSPMLTSRGLGTVLGDLARLGFDAKWGVFRASSIGAAHHRSRFYLVAYTHGAKLEGMDFPQSFGFDSAQSRRRQSARAIDAAMPANDYAQMPRNPDDVARGMDRLKATGNGQVPAVAATAWHRLSRK